MRSPLAIILAVLGLGGLVTAAYFMDLPAYFVQNKELVVAADSIGPDSLSAPLFPDPNRIDFVDEEGWPHWDVEKPFKIKGADEQERILKKNVIEYFKNLN